MSANGKFLLYSANSHYTNNRLKIIQGAVRKIADKLNLKVEVARHKAIKHIFVYYKSNLGEEIPLYNDLGKNGDIEDIYKAIINMIFVLSFHPKHSILKPIRKEVMQFS